LQRLDGPVRGNGQIVRELESAFRGAGWNVIKCLWSEDWDPLLAKDTSGKLVQLMNETVDGTYQACKAKGGTYVRKEFFGKYPETAKLVENMSDEEIGKLRRGGHDPRKVYNAYKLAVEHQGVPTVVLCKTVKGYGMGDAGEGRNFTHGQKELNEKAMEYFRGRFEIPVSDEDARAGTFYKPPDSSPEMAYMHERRRILGGYMPARKVSPAQIQAPAMEYFSDMLEGSRGPDPSTTMAFVKLLTKLMKHPQIGQRVVPIVPDEARTFGMEAMFRQFGIYASQGQLYKPHDS